MLSQLQTLSGLLLLLRGYVAISIDGTAKQVMSGIGASGAWWPIDLYTFPDSVKDRAADLLFNSSSGMGLTSYRYNVGGGGVGVSNPHRAPETFYVSQGVYNWSADPQGVYFLKKAVSYEVPILTAFVNSAPPEFTTFGSSCGGLIVDNQVENYAKYLADIISHFKDEGIVFTHVSPMNEPDSPFGLPPFCDQEGMVVTPFQRANVISAVRSALDSAGLRNVAIMADESNRYEGFMAEAPTWLGSAAGNIGVVAHHDYGFASDVLSGAMGTEARHLSQNKPAWFTEICCYVPSDSSQAGDPTTALTYGQGYDPTIIGALQLGHRLYISFTLVQDAHFDWWTALSSAVGCDPSSDSTCPFFANSKGYNDGLIYYDPNANMNGNHKLYTTKRFFLLKHFTTVVKPGVVLHLIKELPSGVEGLAFRSSSGRIRLILMNMGSSAQSIDLSGVGSFGSAHQTTADADWSSVSVSSTISLPGHSITSLA